ncbi:hypothetical protein ACIQZO_19145 [Streptomyces sp. NPDC097617]|uniref:hypothetical protein n=1 Tax=Streptomyces sp. NPDC097617 TaxID=3366091 RepID=UPI0038023E73
MRPDSGPVHGERAARPREERFDRYDWERARGPITAFGEDKTLAAWATDPRCAVKREALRTRLALGWSPEDAITRKRHDKPTLDYTYQGRTLTLRGWAEQSGIKYHTLYGRITTAGMTFEEALLKGAEGADFTLQVAAFGETKPLAQWAVDPRAGCSVTTMRRRLVQGWDTEQAIAEEPHNRSTLGSGVPHRAYGLSMGLEDWARHTQIPSGVLRYAMDHHDLPLDAALQALGWTPSTTAGPLPDLIEIPAAQLRAGDTVLGTADGTGQGLVLTVRRPDPAPRPLQRPAPRVLPPAVAAPRSTARR